jgi:hypothetical protein
VATWRSPTTNKKSEMSNTTTVRVFFGGETGTKTIELKGAYMWPPSENEIILEDVGLDAFVAATHKLMFNGDVGLCIVLPQAPAVIDTDEGTITQVFGHSDELNHTAAITTLVGWLED